MKINNLKNIKILSTIAAIIVVLIILGSFSCSDSGKFLANNVKLEPFHIKVHAVGQLRSASSRYIGCPPIQRLWNYTITFMAPEGKNVKTGDVILRFDAKELVEKLQLKQSELDTAKKEFERLKLVEQEQLDTLELQLAEFRVQKEKARQKADQPDDLVAQIESKKAKMDMELAKMREHMLSIKFQNQIKGKQTRLHTQSAKINRLQKEVKELRESIENMSVKAPKNGMLVYSTDWRGQKNAVGDRTWKGSTIMELPDLDKMQVKAMIPEPEAWKVKENLPVEIRLDSNPDRIFKGIVKSLGRIFHPKSWDQPMMVFDAIIDVEDPDPELMRPGMAADIDIIVSSRDEVLQIPENALIYREKGIYVWKKSFPGKKLVTVTPGKRSGGMVEILDGLSPNDEILIPREGNGENQ